MFGSDEARGRLPSEWIVSNERVNHGVVLQHLPHQVEQPGVLLVGLEGCEPHEPVQSVVVGRDETGRGRGVPRLTFELVLSPHCSSLLGRETGRGLYHHLGPLLGDA